MRRYIRPRTSTEGNGLGPRGAPVVKVEELRARLSSPPPADYPQHSQGAPE